MCIQLEMGHTKTKRVAGFAPTVCVTLLTVECRVGRRLSVNLSVVQRFGISLHFSPRHDLKQASEQVHTQQAVEFSNTLYTYLPVSTYHLLIYPPRTHSHTYRHRVSSCEARLSQPFTKSSRPPTSLST